MSSTNRGAIRQEVDYYATPLWAIRDFLKYFLPRTPDVAEINELGNIQFKPEITILDPCAGGNLYPFTYKKKDQEITIPANHTMPYVDVCREYGAHDITSLDIRQDSLAEIKGNFLEYQTDKWYDVVITNPPFSLACEITDKALSITREGGYVIMLQRLNWLGSNEREAFWNKHMPVGIYVHRKRMSFLPNGGTDSIEYAHFVWKKGVYNTGTNLFLI